MTLGFGGFTPGHQRLLAKKPKAKMDDESKNKDKMLEDFGSLLNDHHFSDVDFHFSDGSVLHAHKLVLVARSSFFSAMFLNNDTYEETKSGRVNICDIQPDVFKEMLSYLYTTKVPKMHKLAFELLMAADKYDLQELKTMCEKELAKNLNAETMQTYYELANTHNGPELKQKALEYMANWASKQIATMKVDPVDMLNIVNILQGDKLKESSNDAVVLYLPVEQDEPLIDI